MHNFLNKYILRIYVDSDGADFPVRPHLTQSISFLSYEPHFFNLKAIFGDVSSSGSYVFVW